MADAQTNNTQSSVEILFTDLGNLFRDDRAAPQEGMDMKYRAALRGFLDRPTDSEESNRDVSLIRDVATRVVVLREGLHIAFIEGLLDIILRSPGVHWGQNQYRYLARARWIVCGRIEGLLGRRTRGHLRNLNAMPNRVTMSLICSYCGERNIARLCDGCCVRGKDQNFTVSNGYCSRRCQAADWPNHREACKALRLLKRTVSLMVTLFLVAEDQASCLNPISCHKVKEVFMIREESQLVEAMQGKYFVHPFPRHKFATTRGTMMAIGDQIARDLMDQIHPLKVWLWNGLLCKHVEEVSILVKNTDHPIVRSKPDGRKESTALRPHRLFRVTLKTGERYAVDITGSRFGWDEWLVRWDDYKKCRVWRVLSVVPSSFEAPDYSRLPPVNTIPVAVSELHGELIRRMTSEIQYRWGLGATQGGIVADLSANYSRWWDGVILKTMKYMKKKCEVHVWLLTGTSRCGWMYANEKFEPRITVNEEEFNRVKDAWLTVRQVDLLDNTNTALLQRIWTLRLDFHGIKFKIPGPTNSEMLQGITALADPEPDPTQDMQGAQDTDMQDVEESEEAEDMENAVEARPRL